MGYVTGSNKEGNSVFSDEERMQGRCYTALVSACVDDGNWTLCCDGWEFGTFPCVLVWAGLATWRAWLCVCVREGGGRDYKIRWLGGVFVWVSFGVACFVHGLP